MTEDRGEVFHTGNCPFLAAGASLHGLGLQHRIDCMSGRILEISRFPWTSPAIPLSLFPSRDTEGRRANLNSPHRNAFAPFPEHCVNAIFQVESVAIFCLG